MEKLLLRIDEITEILGISRSQAYKMVAAGEIPSLKIGKAIRIPADRLKAWVEAETLGGKIIQNS